MMKTFAIFKLAIIIILFGYPDISIAGDLTDCRQAVPSRAIEACTRLLASGSLSRHQQADAYNARGIAFREVSKNDIAINDFTTAIMLNSNLASAYSDRGLSHHLIGRNDDAIKDLNTALEINPKLVQGYFNRGIFYRRRGKLDLAIGDYTTLIKLNPNHAMAFNNRAYAYLAGNRMKKAMADFNRAAKMSPKDPEIRHSLGDIHFRLGEVDKALKAWNSACQIASPSLVRLWQNRLAAKDYFVGPVNGVCDKRIVKAFRDCAKAKCIF